MTIVAFWKTLWKVLSLSCGVGQRSLSPTANLGKDSGFLDARNLLVFRAHRLCWGQGYAVKSVPHILDSLPYDLGPGIPLAEEGWEGCGVYSGLSLALRLRQYSD